MMQHYFGVAFLGADAAYEEVRQQTDETAYNAVYKQKAACLRSCPHRLMLPWSFASAAINFRWWERDRREQDAPTGGRGEAPNCDVGLWLFGR
jgi:hypothetical protein